MAAYGGKSIAHKDAIRAEKALVALAADLIAHAAYPSYAIQQIARRRAAKSCRAMPPAYPSYAIQRIEVKVAL